MRQDIGVIDLRAARFANDQVRAVLDEMDRFGVERAMIGVGFANERAVAALRDHPDRFFAAFEVDPNAGSRGVRDLRRAVEELGVRSATASPRERRARVRPRPLSITGPNPPASRGWG